MTTDVNVEPLQEEDEGKDQIRASLQMFGVCIQTGSLLGTFPVSISTGTEKTRFPSLGLELFILIIDFPIQTVLSRGSLSHVFQF